MKEEMYALDVNDTWKLLNVPPNKKAIEPKKVFKVKIISDGSPAKNYAQTYGVYYFDIFSLYHYVVLCYVIYFYNCY